MRDYADFEKNNDKACIFNNAKYNVTYAETNSLNVNDFIKEFNTIRPHSTLGYRPPVPEAITVPPTQFQQLGLI